MFRFADERSNTHLAQMVSVRFAENVNEMVAQETGASLLDVTVQKKLKLIIMWLKQN